MPGEEPPIFQNSHTGMGIFHAAKFFFFIRVRASGFTSKYVRVGQVEALVLPACK